MNQRDEIFEMLVERAAPLFGKDKAEITEDMRFAEDLNAKSVHYSQITTYLEDKFDVEIPYMTFRRKKTIGEAVDYVLELTEK
jgi:acyl carrier protein